MNINTQKEAKAAVSILRRELKALAGNMPALSHTQGLELLAKMAGHANWNTWCAKLPADNKAAEVAPQAATAKSNILANLDGEYDFVKPGVRGVPYSGRFLAIQGSYDRVPGTALINSMKRSKSSSEFDVEWAGETDIDWDNQRTVHSDNDEPLYVDEDGSLIERTKVILLPEDFGGDFEELPVRDELVEDFSLCLKDEFGSAAELEKAVHALEIESGLCLTDKEKAALYAQKAIG